MQAAQKKRRVSWKPSKHDEDDSSFQMREFTQVVPSHPNGVKPLGNLYYERPTYNSRTGLGNLACLDDNILLSIFREFHWSDLCRISLVSKAFYVFASTDEIWKQHVVDEYEGNFRFHVNWHHTFACCKAKNDELPLPQPVKVEGFYSDVLFNLWYCSNMDEWAFAQVDNIDRRSNLSVEEFIKQYEEPNIPVIVTDIVPKWPAFTEWNKEKMIANYGDTVFKTDQGVPMKLRDYFQYTSEIHERSPIYVFDNQFGEKAPQLLKDYELPVYFREDFFSVLGEQHRPSFRWILVGPKKSGSSFHKDPNATSAWNGLIAGAKKWILFPPDVTPPGVFPSEDGWEVETPDSIIEWFADFYKFVRESPVKPIECVAKPGDLLFIPSGWWHAVLNLEESIAVTQNVSKKKQALYETFVRELNEKFPGVLERAEKRAKELEPPKKLTMWEQLLQPTTNSSSSTSSFTSSFSLFGDVFDQEAEEMTHGAETADMEDPRGQKRKREEGESTMAT